MVPDGAINAVIPLVETVMMFEVAVPHEALTVHVYVPADVAVNELNVAPPIFTPPLAH